MPPVNLTTWLIAALAFVLAAALTGVARRFVLHRGMLDVPNARSSHLEPTPRGGGIAIVAATQVGALTLFGFGQIPLNLLLALSGGVAVAAIGFADDLEPVSYALRLAVHCLAAGWALVCLHGMAPLDVGSEVSDLGLWGLILAFLGIVWTLNLFNFMDGLDGLAGSQAVFVLGAGGLIAGGTAGAGPAALMAAAAAGGFLLWNWPPAKIFMGDTGSCYLGYLIAVLALDAGRGLPAAPWVWLILGALFFADATITLARRMFRGERVYKAHRTHAFQWLARRWNSHRAVSTTAVLINVTVLLPVGFLAGQHPSNAMNVALITLSALAAVCLGVGSGRQEHEQPVTDS